MSHFLHSFLTASQYIAPLMANFDTSIGRNESEILFATTGMSSYFIFMLQVLSNNMFL